MQKGTIPESVSLCSLFSATSACTCSSGLTKKSIQGSNKDGSSSCSHNLARFRLDFARDGSEQGQRKQPDSRKSLLDLITEDESFMSHPIEKNSPVTSLAKCGQSTIKEQKPDMSDQIKVEPRSVPLSLAQIIQRETGASSVCNMPGELHFNPFRQAQTSCSSKELSLSDLAKLSSRAPSSLRTARVGEKYDITLSDVTSHYKIVSRLPNLSHAMGIHVATLHSTTSVESAGSAPPAVSAFKSDITFQFDHRCVGLSIKGKSNFFALILSHPTEDSVPHSLSRLRQCIDEKLTKDYISYVFKIFDFSSQSPDDIVQEKQRNVFQR